MEDIEVPQYFLCPISLQIMKDPVTTASGITYDRENIEHWLATSSDKACPITKQPLPLDPSELTPNHMLRRLIQAWCVTNATNGVDRIPTPKYPPNRSHLFKLIRDLQLPELFHVSLNKLLEIAQGSQKNRACMVEAGVIKAMVSLLLRFYREENIVEGLGEALRILHLIWDPTMEVTKLVNDRSSDLVKCFSWILNTDSSSSMKTDALLVLKKIVLVLSSSILERLEPEFFDLLVKLIKVGISPKATKAAIHVLVEACPWGRNRVKIVEAGAVFELIELELSEPGKKTSELIFSLLAQLCSCADGRAAFLNHHGGIAMVAKRMLRVSPFADDGAIQVLTFISKFSATHEVLMEMLGVGAVTKLCMVLQVDSAKHVKDKARGILRSHSNVWNNSPCIAVYFVTKDPR